MKLMKNWIKYRMIITLVINVDEDVQLLILYYLASDHEII